MTDERQSGVLFESWLKDTDPMPPDARPSVANVMAKVPHVRQRGRWWPLPVFDRPAPIPATDGRQPARGFTMFSALKFIAAGAIVALFGGFLLAGVLTTPDGEQMAPAAVTESPEPEVISEATEPPDPSVRTDILPGVALNVEEVEPGVLWVVNDGQSDFAYPVDPEVPSDIVAGHDGGIYVFEPGHYTRLGQGGGSAQGLRGFDWNIVAAFPSDVGVAPDGTVWAVFGSSLYSTPWGSGHETRHLTTTGPDHVEVTSDGTVWAVWRDDSGSAVFGYLGDDGWTMVGEWPFDGGYLDVSDRGDVWAAVHFGWGQFRAHRFVDGAWREEDGSGFDPVDWGFKPPADVGVDGTLWGVRRDRLVRFDGTEWTTFEPPDWVPTDVREWRLTEDGWVGEEDYMGTSVFIFSSWWGEPHLAPDGSLWVPHQLGVLAHDPDLGGGHQVVCDHGIDGVVRFDGETWSRFLQGRCVEAMDIAADGSVWVLASRSDARYPLAHYYVITPEAVAASE